MYTYFTLFLVIADALYSESAWEFDSRQNSNDNVQFFFYSPNLHFRAQRQETDDFLNYDYSDDSGGGWRNNGMMLRQQWQQSFQQNPTQQSVTNVDVCIRGCPTTSEYNPVCGSNGVTYTNPSRLECAKYCGVDVQLSRRSRCPIPGLETPSPSTEPTASSELPIFIPLTLPPSPVTPTPSTITPTPSTVTPTPSTVTPTPSPVTPTPSPVTNGLGFTIPQDILDNIFTTNYGGLIDER
ncbi:hypothetical protein evm_001063 [Chilo suppressalis]|nr:hypothetical protein evm_001063 [Chilo suppressalis]